MVARKERTLLIEVASLDAQSAPPAAALHNEMRDAMLRAHAASSAAALQPRHYCRAARLCMVRTSLDISRAVRIAIGSIRYVKHWPVKLSVVRAFGNERRARRAFAEALEAALGRTSDAEALKAIREQLSKLVELQKA